MNCSLWKRNAWQHRFHQREMKVAGHWYDLFDSCSTQRVLVYQVVGFMVENKKKLQENFVSCNFFFLQEMYMYIYLYVYIYICLKMSIPT